jgi:hypothetical protein
MKIGLVNVIFTYNIKDDIKEYLKSLSLLKKNGEPYKSVKIDESYFFKGKLVTQVVAKGEEVIFTNLPLTVSMDDILGSYNIQIGGKVYNNSEIHSDHIILSGKKISKGSNSIDMVSDPQLMQYITKNNAEIIKPVTNKYYNILSKVKNNRIIGYFNVNIFNQLVKTYLPISSINMSSSSSSLKFERNDELIDVFFKNNVLEINGINVESSSSSYKSVPFVLITSKPSGINNKSLPYKAIKYKSSILFITPLQVKDESVINKYPGTVNLLS